MKPVLIFLSVLLLQCGSNQNYIKIKGSDTEVNLVVRLAEAFHKTNPAINISVSGGGSGLGIASLINGQADIANSSRTMNVHEQMLFEKKHIAIDTFVFAEDAICFVVSQTLPIDSISLPDLGKILSGAYRNWITLTGKNVPVNIYGRQTNSGTYDFVKQKLGIEFSAWAKEMNGNAQIIEAIKADHSGIGYVGAGYVIGAANQPIKVLKIFSAKGSLALLPFGKGPALNSSYYFKRYLYQYIKKEAREKTAPFLAFEKSDTGLAIIRAAGYYAVPSN